MATFQNKILLAPFLGRGCYYEHFLLSYFLFCYALVCVHSSIAIILKKEKVGCFAVIVLPMYCYYKCSVALPHGPVGWSAVCDCGIS